MLGSITDLSATGARGRGAAGDEHSIRANRLLNYLVRSAEEPSNDNTGTPLVCVLAFDASSACHHRQPIMSFNKSYFVQEVIRPGALKSLLPPTSYV
jgi:hypothetical protein